METENFENIQSLLSDRIKAAIKQGITYEADSELSTENAKEIKSLIEAKCILDDSAEKAYIEELKLDIEKQKADIDWKHFAIEAGKIMVPLLLGIAQIRLFRESRDIAGKFEESGRYTTEIGRKTALPNIFKWR